MQNAIIRFIDCPATPLFGQAVGPVDDTTEVFYVGVAQVAQFLLRLFGTHAGMAIYEILLRLIRQGRGSRFCRNLFVFQPNGTGNMSFCVFAGVAYVDGNGFTCRAFASFVSNNFKLLIS